MTEEVKACMEKQKAQMEAALQYLEKELGRIRAGKASPQMLEGIRVDYYGNMTPLDQVGAINTPDARQIVVQPWEKKMLPVIEKAILAANLGFTPQNNGEVIRITLPPLSEDRRKEMMKNQRGNQEARQGQGAAGRCCQAGGKGYPGSDGQVCGEGGGDFGGEGKRYHDCVKTIL